MRNLTLGLCASAILVVIGLGGCGNGDSAGAVSIADDFDDDRKDTEKWGPEEFTGPVTEGSLDERDGMLEFTGSESYLEWPWIATVFPYDSDWEVQVDVEHAIDLADHDHGQYPSVGIAVYKRGDHAGNRFRFELYMDSGDEYRGFYLDGSGVARDTHEIPDLTRGALRIRYDSTTLVHTLYYDVDTSDGYQWTQFTRVSVDEGYPADNYLDWDEMTETDQFDIGLYGNGSHIEQEMLRADNFRTIGGFRP